MILLTCTNCRQTLEIDDAFAGGVCRCSHCGAIQTVPSHLKGSATPAGGSVHGAQVAAGASTNGVAAGGSRTLYARGEASQQSGLEALGDVVSGSGIAGSGFGARRPSGKAAGKASKAKGDPTGTRMLALAVAALAVVLAGGLILYLTNVGRPTADAETVAGNRPAPRSTGSAASTPTNAGSANPPANAGEAPDPPADAGPSFAGVPIAADSVAYVLDRGDSARQTFGFATQLALDSARRLGPGRRYQILFWDPSTGGDEAKYDSPDQLRLADADALDRTAKALDEVYAAGQTEPDAAFRRAAEQDPKLIVLVTAKGWQLDAAFADRMVGLLGGRTIRVDTFALGGGESDGLRQLADRTGGTFVPLDLSRLRELVQ